VKTFLTGSMVIAAGIVLWVLDANSLVTIALLLAGMFCALVGLVKRQGRRGDFVPNGYVDSGSAHGGHNHGWSDGGGHGGGHSGGHSGGE
jgi:hypothetical protein